MRSFRSREAKGKFEVAKRPKSKASKRWIQLPPFLAALYEALLEDLAGDDWVFQGPHGGLLRRGHFIRRYWRPSWDGDPDNPDPQKRTSPILTGFTFHDGRHTQRTWLSEVEPSQSYALTRRNLNGPRFPIADLGLRAQQIKSPLLSCQIGVLSVDLCRCLRSSANSSATK